MDFLVVDFDKTATNEVGLACIVFSFSYDLTEGPGDDTPVFLAAGVAHHSVCFTASCLTICEDGPVVTVEDALDEEESTLLVDHALSGIRCEDVVEGERFGLLFGIFFAEVNLFKLAIDVYNALAIWIGSQFTSIFLFLVHGSAPNHDFDCFCHSKPLIKILYQNLLNSNGTLEPSFTSQLH